MKKMLIVLSILVAFCLIAAEVPPALPSSFYGTASGLKAGTPVNVWVGGKIAARTKTFNYPGYGVVYTVDVSMDGVADGTIATFKIGNHTYATKALHSGTNQNVKLVMSSLK
jgi:hypothetical protein